MRRGTTPTLRIPIDGIEVTKLNEIYLTFEQEADHCCNSVQITKRESDITINEEDNLLEIEFAQEETLKFKQAPVKVQMRAVTTDGKRIATNTAEVNVYAILLDGVI